MSQIKDALRMIAQDDSKPDMYRVVCALGLVVDTSDVVTTDELVDVLDWPEERILTALLAAEEHGLVTE